MKVECGCSYSWEEIYATKTGVNNRRDGVGTEGISLASLNLLWNEKQRNETEARQQWRNANILVEPHWPAATTERQHHWWLGRQSLDFSFWLVLYRNKCLPNGVSWSLHVPHCLQGTPGLRKALYPYPYNGCLSFRRKHYPSFIWVINNAT